MLVTLLRRFCQGSEFIVRMAGYAASGLMPVLAAIVSFEVFSRYFLNRPTVWAFDLSLFLFGYIASLAGAYAHQKRSHISVDIFYLKVSQKTRRVFDLITFSLAIFFLVLIIYVCYGKMQDALQFNIRRQSEWAPQMLHFWIMSMVASGLFLLQLVKDMIADLYYLFTGRHLLETEGEDYGESHLIETEEEFISGATACEAGGE